MAKSLLQRSRIFPCLIFLLLSTELPAHARSPVSIEEYRALIRESVDLVQTRGGGPISSEDAALLRERFPVLLPVTGGEKTSGVDGRQLGRWIDEAENSSEGRARLLIHMNALLDQIGLDPGPPFPWKRGSEALDAVFESREFRHLNSEPSWWKEWLQERLHRIMEWLDRHFKRIEGKTLTWISLAILGALAIAGIILMVWAIRSTGRFGWRWRQPALRGTKDSPEEFPAPDWKKLRADAEEKAERGELREAVRALFLSMLQEGHVKGWWVYRPESTNTEHLRQIAGPPARADAFRSLAEVYESAWYGLKPPERKDFAACRQWVERMGAV